MRNFMFGGILSTSTTIILLAWMGALHSHEEHPYKRRVKELSYNTTTYILLDSNEASMFEKGDTVWFDRKTHKHDVLAYDATKVVIIK